MPSASVRKPLAFGEASLPIHWTWGAECAPERSGAKCWGVAIEVPAVVELLRLVEGGKATAAEVREAVETFAEVLNQRLDLGEPDPDDV